LLFSWDQAFISLKPGYKIRKWPGFSFLVIANFLRNVPYVIAVVPVAGWAIEIYGYNVGGVFIP
jgi:hypothetical protein